MGSVRSSDRELLYEQCSLHMTLNMASSRSLGVAAEALDDGVELVVGQAQRAVQEVGGLDCRAIDRLDHAAASTPSHALDQRAKQEQPVVRAEDCLRGTLGVRHQAADPSRRRR